MSEHLRLLCLSLLLLLCSLAEHDGILKAIFGCICCVEELQPLIVASPPLLLSWLH